MNECVDFKKLLTAAAVIVVASLLSLSYFQDFSLGLNYATLTAATTSAAVVWVCWLLFKNWLWKMPVLRYWLVKIPDLNGSWQGEMQSTWKDPSTKENVPPIQITAKITQTLTEISVDFQTGEMDSQSVVATMHCDPHRRTTDIKYIYLSEPDATVRKRSELHYGAAKMDVKQAKDGSQMLRGNYWTSRETTGTIELTKVDT